MKYDIFISYSRWDFSYAKEQIEALSKSLGLSCFYDVELTMGERFTSEITETISSSRIVVLFYSHDILNSTWNKHELNYAESVHKPIILVNLESDAPRGWYATHFNHEYISYNYGEGIGDIIKAVNAILRHEVTKFPQSINASVSSINPGYSHAERKCEEEVWIDQNFDEWNESLDCFYNEHQQEIEKELVEQEKRYRCEIEESEMKCPQQTVRPVSGRECVYARCNVESSEAHKKKSIWSRLFSKEHKSKHLCLVKFLSHEDCSVYIDGKLCVSLISEGFGSAEIASGEYIFKYESKNGQSYSEIINIGNESAKAILVRFKPKLVDERDEFKTIQCFIAGSTGLKMERRSFCYVMSRLHNQWHNRKFSIESYSYEDFSRSVQTAGQQTQYNDFIRNKADIIMFVFDSEIGDVTLDELNIAIGSYQKKLRPKIYVYSKQKQMESDKMKSLRERMDRLNQYWVDYKDIDDLEMQFEHDMNWYLFDLYKHD